MSVCVQMCVTIKRVNCIYIAEVVLCVFVDKYEINCMIF